MLRHWEHVGRWPPAFGHRTRRLHHGDALRPLPHQYSRQSRWNICAQRWPPYQMIVSLVCSLAALPSGTRTFDCGHPTQSTKYRQSSSYGMPHTLAVSRFTYMTVPCYAWIPPLEPMLGLVIWKYYVCKSRLKRTAKPVSRGHSRSKDPFTD